MKIVCSTSWGTPRSRAEQSDRPDLNCPTRLFLVSRASFPWLGTRSKASVFRDSDKKSRRHYEGGDIVSWARVQPCFPSLLFLRRHLRDFLARACTLLARDWWRFILRGFILPPIKLLYYFEPVVFIRYTRGYGTLVPGARFLDPLAFNIF